jgi:hypothetical protein
MIAKERKSKTCIRVFSLAIVIVLASYVYGEAQPGQDRQVAKSQTDPSLVACYELNGDGKDTGPAGRDATCHDVKPCEDRHQAPDKALLFNGNGYLEIADSPEFHLETLTICAWVAPIMNSDELCVLLSKDDGFEGFQFFMEDQKRLYFGLGDGNAWHNMECGFEFPSDRWHHVAATCDGKKMTLFVDGKATATMGFVGKVVYGERPIQIGRNGFFLSQNFRGKIDDLRIYDRAITQAELTELCRGWKAKLAIPEIRKIASGHDSEIQEITLEQGKVGRARREGLAAYYPLVGNADDDGGKGNHGLAGNITPARNRFGEANSACSFDGNKLTDYIVVKDSASLHMTNASFAVWIRPNSQTQANGYVFSKDFVNGGTCFHLVIEAAGLVPSFAVNRWGNRGMEIRSAQGLTRNQWHQIAGTYDGSELELYVDGELKNCFPYIGGLDTDNGMPLVIGQKNYLAKPPAEPDWPFSGDIDELRIYSRRISDVEVRSLYQEPR